MASINQAWYNLNSTRTYPFDDGATLRNDNDQHLPVDIIAGLKILIPEPAGHCVFLGAISVTPNLVTMIFMASTTLDSADRTPVLSLNLRRPIDRYTQYELRSLYPEAGGWLALGPGIDNVNWYSGRFASPRQSLLAPRAASWFKPLPISSIAKLNSPGLTGLVQLKGGNNIEIVKECREVPAYPVPGFDPQYCGSDELGMQVRQAIVFRLKDTSTRRDVNVFELYKGPCQQRPESRNCGDPQPIEFLGPVTPDCCGNITLVLAGCASISAITQDVTTDDDNVELSREVACGVIVDCGLGLAEACVTKDRLPGPDGRLPNEYDALCMSVSYASVSAVVVPTTEPTFSFDDLQAESSSDSNLPVSDSFETLGDYTVRSGSFVYEPVDSGQVLAGNSPTLRNLVTYDPTPAITSVLYKKVTAEVSLIVGSVGIWHNAAVVTNFHITDAGRQVYYVAEIDWDGQYRGYKLFRIAKFNGTSWISLFSIPVPTLQCDDHYTISLSALPQAEDPNNAWLLARLVGITDPLIDITIGPLAVSNFGSGEGRVGLGTNRALSHFHSFTVENIITSP